MSIIVHESADATDLNDGFGTAELVVGVRAYQWGWEYYYPKSIDLHYNVKPSYSTFIGNSLKYNSASSKTLSTNHLWRMYQNKAEDRVITPAHLLLTPVDSGNMVNFLNFKNIGLDTLQESSAFSKIRNSSKVYNSHLVHTPSTFSSKYFKLNALYVDENKFLTTTSFGVEKQHNLSSTSALGNTIGSSFLDSASFNKFLESNSVNCANLEDSSAVSPLSLQKADPLSFSANAYSAASALQSGSSALEQPLDRLLNYPSLLDHLNDDSDKSGLDYPATKLSSASLDFGKLNNSETVFSRASSSDFTSSTSTSPELFAGNYQQNSRAFNLMGPNSKVLAGDQSIRHFPDTQPSKANLNLSSGVNTVSSNLNSAVRLNQTVTPYDGAVSSLSDYSDYSQSNSLLSARSFASEPLPAVISSSARSNSSLEYDSTTHRSAGVQYSTTGDLVNVSQSKKTAVGDVFSGSREKTPASINTAYWSTFWSTTSPIHRMEGSLRASAARSSFYLPVFSTYADYDFRNDQAIDMLEELFWESSYSGYNFYDYMTLSKNMGADQLVSAKDFDLEKQFHSSNMGNDPSRAYLSGQITKDLSLLGEAYSSSVQMEDSIASPSELLTRNFALLSTYAELNELDDSFSNIKNLNHLFDKNSNSILGASSYGLAPRSYISVLNYFRSDFEDFSWHRNSESSVLESDLALVSSLSTSSESLENFNTDLTFGGAAQGNDLRLSNPATLRSSARNSIVNYNAFQKVFKPRLDESRAHVQGSSFADMSLKQPFLSDSKVPYTQLLGKNRDSFYETPLYFKATLANFNSTASLMEAINTPMYDFPFLLAKTSDTTRFTWIDWFSKWKHVEVQPSSISKYSTIGAPYMRKPFDFNSATGDKFQDTELYFTRVARSRRNYLTNWSYSPFMYNRAYIWDAFSNIDSLFLDDSASTSSAKQACAAMSWYWRSPALINNLSSTPNFTLSGNDIYNKSTWRPKSSIQSYYYKVSKLSDILSRREHLYRRYLESAHGVTEIPTTLCATPNNPLLRDLKASFLFTDPASFSSEYSRDFLYSSTPYFKFVQLKALSEPALNTLQQTQVNTSLLTEYVFFYFFGTPSAKSGNVHEIYKNQYRPLKKGISSMLRLHSTGAVAMPIEIRLQVLASSRDVIHSWAIPSANVKIDCVPGYTSHRMMKFLLTGVYWGQCQEICGRYHHWMPIVVYFMKRDLFFLWCTHFVFTPAVNETWDVSDKRFSDFIRFVSYDKSSWLNEFGAN